MKLDEKILTLADAFRLEAIVYLSVIYILSASMNLHRSKRVGNSVQVIHDMKE